MKPWEALRIGGLAAFTALAGLVGCSGSDPAPTPSESEEPSAPVDRDARTGAGAAAKPGVDRKSVV